ncbi:MAG: shikimate kinase [Acidobacteriota bacterium]
MILKLKRTPGIYLVGFMGSGKSTVGRALADELGWKFVDLDEEIERREATAISKIFETRGEPEFREIETKVLREQVRAVETGRPHVIALGGGTFQREVNVDLLVNHGVTIWLDCPLDRIEERLAGFTHRPLARDPQKLRELFDARRSGYAHADYRVDCDHHDPMAVVAMINLLGLI